MKIYLDAGAIMPTRAHETDAGLDIYTPIDLYVPEHGSAVVDTGVHVEIPEHCAGILKSKSGLNVKSDLTSSGVIDCGFVGSMVVKLYNHGDVPRQIKAGQKVSQLVVIPVCFPDLEIVDDLKEFKKTERGSNGFGSTGK